VTWTYNTALTAAKDIVRRMIGDVLTGDQQLQDEEITYALTQYSNNYLAAAECCRWISAQFSRKVDTVTAEMRTTYSAQAKAYIQRAFELQALGMSRGAGSMPYVGGISVTDKANQLADTDRVTPQFNVGMNENELLGPGPGNETPGNPDGGNG